MSGDPSRVELREQVNELQATVNALTQEIAEINERIRSLEQDHDSNNRSTDSSSDGDTDKHTEFDDIIIA